MSKCQGRAGSAAFTGSPPTASRRKPPYGREASFYACCEMTNRSGNSNAKERSAANSNQTGFTQRMTRCCRIAKSWNEGNGFVLRHDTTQSNRLDVTSILDLSSDL